MNPKNQIRDTVLANASDNIQDDDTLTGLLETVERSILNACLSGMDMVDFDDYRRFGL